MEFVLSGHEINLKGQNRGFFATRLRMNLDVLLEGTGARVRTLGRSCRVIVPDEHAAEARQRLERALGVQTIVAGRRVTNELSAIAEAALHSIALQSGETFGLRVRRQEKRLPFTSRDVAIFAGRYIQERLGLRVDLDAAERRCTILVTRDGAFVTPGSEPGPGGMPAGTAGKLVGLLSAGFDSPVAAYRMMRRGASLALLHFYGTGPRPGESSRLTVDELARRLTAYQLHTALYFCHFEPIQREIVLRAPAEYRVLLYRRMMLRVGAALARQVHAHGLVTGDSLAQVASQTLRNLEAVGAAVALPIYRPLIGSDKVEIIAEARRLGTFEYSAENPHDCCSAFMPSSPALAASAEELERAESGLDLPALVAGAMSSLEWRRLKLAAGRVVEVAPVAPAPQHIDVA